jgi:hypothetical protein
MDRPLIEVRRRWRSTILGAARTIVRSPVVFVGLPGLCNYPGTGFPTVDDPRVRRRWRSTIPGSARTIVRSPVVFVGLPGLCNYPGTGFPCARPPCGTAGSRRRREDRDQRPAFDPAGVDTWSATVLSVISQDVVERVNVAEGVEDQTDPVRIFRSRDLWSTLRHL